MLLKNLKPKIAIQIGLKQTNFEWYISGAAFQRHLTIFQSESLKYSAGVAHLCNALNVGVHPDGLIIIMML